MGQKSRPRTQRAQAESLEPPGGGKNGGGAHGKGDHNGALLGQADDREIDTRTYTSNLEAQAINLKK